MKTKYWFIILFVALFLQSGCKVDYAYLTIVNIENRSGYDIEIKAGTIGSEIPRHILIPKGETYTFKISTEGGYCGFPLSPRALIRFGDQVQTFHQESDKDRYHNYSSPNAYTKNEPEKRVVEYTFTFTDADYEYAKEHPGEWMS